MNPTLTHEEDREIQMIFEGRKYSQRPPLTGLLSDDFGEPVLTVAILINGNPIMARSAVNSGKSAPDNRVPYDVDDGSIVYHDPDDGAIALAHKLLDTIKEQGR